MDSLSLPMDPSSLPMDPPVSASVFPTNTGRNVWRYQLRTFLHKRGTGLQWSSGQYFQSGGSSGWFKPCMGLLFAGARLNGLIYLTLLYKSPFMLLNACLSPIHKGFTHVPSGVYSQSGGRSQEFESPCALSSTPNAPNPIPLFIDVNRWGVVATAQPPRVPHASFTRQTEVATHGRPLRAPLSAAPSPGDPSSNPATTPSDNFIGMGECTVYSAQPPPGLR